MQYELFYLVGASKEADLEKITQETSKIIASEGGVFEEKQVIEKRKLAYPVKHEKYGFYVAQRFEMADTEKFKAVNKRLNLHSEILRFLISRAEELPELLSRKEREEIKLKKDRESRKERSAEIKISESREEKPAQAAKQVPEEKATEEDIDEKLKEILNI